MKKIFTFLSSAVLLFSQTVSAQSLNTDYIIYDTKKQQLIDLDGIVNDVDASTILLFGEQHDDSIAHLLQLELYKKINAAFNNKVVLSLEMFETDVQSILNEYLSGIISEKNFKKEARSWGNYIDYRPLVELAKEKNLPVIAANAPARYVNLVTRKGLQALNTTSKEVQKNWIAPLPVDTLTGIYHEKFLEVLGGHVAPGMHLYQSQNFWDATMAYSIVKAQKAYKKQPILHLNGRFHSDYKSGLAHRLINQYKKNVLTISSFYAEDLSNINWQEHNTLGDYVIVTRKINREQKLPTSR